MFEILIKRDVMEQPVKVRDDRVITFADVDTQVEAAPTKASQF